MGTASVADVAGPAAKWEVTIQGKFFSVVEKKESASSPALSGRAFSRSRPTITSSPLFLYTMTSVPSRCIYAHRGQTMEQLNLIAGARPNFVKIAPIIDARNADETRRASLRFRLIHTGPTVRPRHTRQLLRSGARHPRSGCQSGSRIAPQTDQVVKDASTGLSTHG